MEAIHALLVKLVDFIGSMDYWGIYLLTFIESTFIPLPSELVVIPAGYLAHQGVMNFWLLFLVATLGTLSGAAFNYWLGMTLGRKFLLAYGKYMFISEPRFRKVEHFFQEHGAISTFSGRLIPGVRHLIPIPAGIARMDFGKFCFYTTLGGGIWMLVLLTLGYLIGHEKDLLQRSLHLIQAFLGVFIILLAVSYGWYYSKKAKGPNVRMANIEPAHEAFVRAERRPPAPGKPRGPKVRMANIEPAHEALELMAKKNQRKKPAKGKAAKKTVKKTGTKKPAARKTSKKGQKRGGKR